MADCDVALTDAAGMSASNVANLLGKSRQAVSKGLKSKHRYFRDEEVAAIYDTAVAAKPHAKHGLQELIKSDFGDLADRLLAGDAEEELVEAVAGSHRVWVIAPNYMQARSYSGKQIRWLLRHLTSSGLDEIVVICDSELETREVSREFPAEMFAKGEVAVFQCEVAADLLFMVVTFAANATKGFVLTKREFAALPDYETHRLIKAVHQKLSSGQEEQG